MPSLIALQGMEKKGDECRPCLRGGSEMVESYIAGEGLKVRPVPSGCRHSVSVKILMLPPAVRMYSTFPAAIQL
jgi:hypothetical protein